MKTKHLFFALTFFVLVSGSAFPVLSQCVTPFEVGSWKNIDPETGGILRLQVDFTCQDQVLNGQPYPPGSPFHIHLWGKCSPSECDWGTVDGNPVNIGGTEWIHGTYNQGFAKREVYIKPSSLFPGDLFLWMFTNFSDPNRADYVFKGWYVK